MFSETEFFIGGYQPIIKINNSSLPGYNVLCACQSEPVEDETGTKNDFRLSKAAHHL